MAAADLAAVQAVRAEHEFGVEIQNASGVWTDLRALGATVSGQVTEGLDDAAAQATVVLRSGRGTSSIMPGITASSFNASGRLIDVGRGLRVTTRVSEPGAPRPWVTLFEGTVQQVKGANPAALTLIARNRMQRILDAEIGATASYGGVGGIAVENVLQNLINDVFGTGVIPLITPVSPSYGVTPYTVPAGTMLWAALSRWTDAIGWFLRYRWNANTPELRFFAPRRAPTSADWTIGPSAYTLVDLADYDLEPIRNRVRVSVVDPATGGRLVATADRSASQAAYGVRPMRVTEDRTSHLRTLAQAQTMADAIADDLAIPPFTHALTTKHLWWGLEPGDVVDCLPNAVHYDATQRLAVSRVTHVLDPDGCRTQCLLRGQPASRGRSWLSFAGADAISAVTDPQVSLSFTTGGGLIINVVGPTDATQLRAAVSTTSDPSIVDVDAATGTLAANASMARLSAAGPYAVGTRVYVAVRAYVAGVGGRLVRTEAVRDVATGTAAVGPDLDVRVIHNFGGDESIARIEYVGDGTITMSENGGPDVAPPASPFTRTRAAAGSNEVRSLAFRAELNGQVMSNTVFVMPRATVDTDTVAPDLRLIRDAGAGGDAAAFVAFTVQVSNPKVGGPVPTVVGTWTGTTVERFNGLGWTTMTSGAALLAGDLLRMSRPANGATPGSFTARATISGGGAEDITVTIPQRAVDLPPACVARVVASDATTVTVEVSTVPGPGTVRYRGGSATRLSGPAVDVDSPNATQWVFARAAINAGSRDALFRGTFAGVSDEDVVVIEEQGRDTVPLLARARVIAIGPTTYTVRVSASAPYADRDATITLVQASGLTITRDGAGRIEGNTDSVTQSTTDGYYGGIGGAAGVAFRDYVVTRPPVGAQPARVTFRVSAPGVTDDLDSVDVEPQRVLTPGRIELITTSQSGALYTVAFRMWDANGVLLTNPNTGDGAFAIARIVPPGGTPSTVGLTVTYSGANNWLVVDITRPAGAAISLEVGFAVRGDTARTVATFPIPVHLPIAAGGGDAIVTASVTANGGASFTASAVVDSALVGATLRFFADYRYSGGGTDILGAGTGGISLGEVASTFTGPFHIVPPIGGEAVYIMRVLFEAYVGGRLVGTSYASALFYVDTGGT